MIPVLKKAEYAKKIARFAQLVIALLVALVLVVAFALQLSGLRDASIVVLMAAMILAGTAWATLDGALLIRSQDLTRLGIRNALTGVLGAVFQLGFGLAVPNPVSLAAAIAAGRLLAVLLTPKAASRAYSDNASGLDRYRVDAAAWGVSTGVLNGATLQLPAAAIGVVGGEDLGGQAVTAQRVSSAPMSFVGLALAQVVAARVAALLQTDRSGISSYLRRTLIRLTVASATVTIAIIVIALNYATAIFGPEWKGIGVVIALIAPMAGAQLAVSPITVVLPLLEKQRLLFVFEIVRITLIVSTIAVVGSVTSDHILTVAAWSSVAVANYIGLACLTLHATKKL